MAPYLDENNGILNKLYAVCKNSLRWLILGMMIAAAGVVAPWPAETWFSNECNAIPPWDADAIVEFDS
jgi:hypothetical protein